MKKADLKTFDIETYDIELDFNKQIAPIQKKIDRLDNTHETKSLKAHKDFLAKEKASKAKLSELEEKTTQRIEKIEKATENKIIKTSKKENAIKKEFDEYKVAQNEALSIEIEEINARTLELKEQEQKDIQVVKDKYKKNVESYVEKLDTYNNNFENNKLIFSDQYAKYSQSLEESLELIDSTKKQYEQDIIEKLENFKKIKADEDEVSKENLKQVEKELANYVLQIRKDNNAKSQQDQKYVSSLKKRVENQYNHKIEAASDVLRKIEQIHKSRIKLINKDLEINLSKLESLKENLEGKELKRVQKDINIKSKLFSLRAKTTLEYEDAIFVEKQAILNNEIAFLQKTLQFESINFDKLYVFLMNDNEQLKETGEFFKSLNLDMKKELTKSELANNEFLVGNESLQTDFLRNYTEEFNTIKKRLIDANKSQIEQLTTINSELDDINKFLDTVEPLKEIELNHLRESIECNEIEERYNIKYAKQDHETKLLQNNSKKEISLQELKMKDDIKENNKIITEIKAKEVLDKAAEASKLKYQKAEEIKKLRMNSTKLETNILKSSYETELDKADLNKELVEVEVKKDNAILIKSIEKEIANIEMQAKYKSEVVTKSNEEEILKLQEQITKIESERDSFITSVEGLLLEEEHKTDDQIATVNQEIDGKLAMIDEALERECKEPLLNIARNEAIIKEKLHKFEQNEISFKEFILQLTESFNDTTINLDQHKTMLIKNKTILERSKTFISQAYSYLTDALMYMNETFERRQLSIIASTSDEAKVKKSKKQIEKDSQDLKRLISSAKQSEKDQIARITTLIKGNTQRLGKLKGLEDDALKSQMELILNNHLSQLITLQQSILKEAKQIYIPLTKSDQEIVDYANKNAIKAKENIERDRELQIAPVNKEFGDFIKEKNDEKERVVYDYNQRMKLLNEQINTLKAQSTQKINAVNEEQFELIKHKKQQLEETKAQENALIEQKIQEIARQKLALEQQYADSLKKLEEKDEEAQKIYEFEERIYQIALETAESRYNETVAKAEKASELLKSNAHQSVQSIKDLAERNIERINKELLDLTNQFEKNIFTVRPRFEESIGDAQKAIEDKATIMIARRAELLEQNQMRTVSIEEGLHNSFKEAYQKLQDNLQQYIDKNKLIETEYKESITQTNKVITLGTVSFIKSLYDLGKHKIEKTGKRLMELNNKIK